MNKLLSIVIPVYNTEKYLERCLDSLVYYGDILEYLDIIVVNDGSKDKSLEIAKRYASKYDAIRVIDKENGGHGSTINRGLKEANGKYFRVIDSDDWVNVDDVRKYVLDLKNIDCDIVITNFSREYVYNGISSKFEYPKEIEFNKVYDADEFDYSLFKEEYFFMATTSYKTSLLKEMNFSVDEKMFYVDMEYVTFPIPNVKNFILLDYDIYRYFIGRPDQSINIKGFVKNRLQHEIVLKKLIDFCVNTEMNDNKKKLITKIIVLMCNTHYNIYCKSRLLDKKYKKEIKQFDKWFKDTSKELYDAVSKKYMYSLE